MELTAIKFSEEGTELQTTEGYPARQSLLWLPRSLLRCCPHAPRSNPSPARSHRSPRPCGAGALAREGSVEQAKRKQIRPSNQVSPCRDGRPRPSRRRQNLSCLQNKKASLQSPRSRPHLRNPAPPRPTLSRRNLRPHPHQCLGTPGR